jgi:hypothetical protein
MDNDTKPEYENWLEEIDSYNPQQKLERANHLWNEYQHRHNLVWSLVFRLTTAVVVLAVVPYTQDKVTERMGGWILAPPILGVVLAIVGFGRVRREVKLLDQLRELYRRLQDSLFFKFHGDRKCRFGEWVLFYILVLIALATINALLLYP